MKYLKYLLGLMAFLPTIKTDAQENLNFSQKAEIVSPQINGSSATFRLFAPLAHNVYLQGNWIQGKGMVAGAVPMNKGADGLWSYTKADFKPDIYTYSFLVDSVKINDPNNVYVIRDVASVMNLFFIDGEGASDYKVTNVAHGTVSMRWYESAGLKMSRRIAIYTPPGYENSHSEYPVLYLLHGVGGDENAWMSLGRVSQILDNLIAQGKAVPMVVVMPNGHTINSAAPGESSKGFYKPIMMTPDVFNGDMETYFKEIIFFTEKNYRVKKDKKDRAIAGLSMGGFHSLYISANYPNMFDYIGLFSPAVLPPNNNTSPIYKDFNKKLEMQKENKYSLYWIGIGKDDFLYGNIVKFRQQLDSIGLQYHYMETNGGHTWSNWRTYLDNFLPLLFK